MNRVAVVRLDMSTIIPSSCFIFIFFFEHKFILKKLSYIVISTKKVAQETREIAYCHSFL